MEYLVIPQVLATNSYHTVRVYRVDNVTGELSDSFGFTTLAKGGTYDSFSTWKWFVNRLAAITAETGNCPGFAVMTEEDSSNDYEISNALFDSGKPDVITGDMDGVINSRDVRAIKSICTNNRCSAALNYFALAVIMQH